MAIRYQKVVDLRFQFYSVLSSSKSPAGLSLPRSGLTSGTFRTSFDGEEIGDGLMSVRFVSSLSNSSCASSEYEYLRNKKG